jgi:shikimate kinase
MIPGVVIENPSCTDKTYPAFWQDLEKAYLSPIKLGKKHLVLTGMRGAGKSFLGKKIARHLKRRFIDLDHEIESDQKMKISEIVKRYGWPKFRKIEQKICSKFGAAEEPLVIATGGGVVLSPENMKALKRNGMNVFIFADPGILIKRIKNSKARPPLTGLSATEGEVYKIWNERRGLYLKYADFVWDDTSGKIVKQSLNEIF